ncbi:IDEAL domain-containing protein [Paenibacillus alkalitolerans]|uniref:IDEAL domain-containing protein n=1 Tax=Paenibacillus alkalitolerans TaxID=2799335 RepID=UPI0018F297B4|nr:IDEAL domain-containing protein [Paenibacillus alkalitolerans]
MERMYYEPVRDGDWVSGTSDMDEIFIGYVESMDAGGMLTVRVTQCDREEAVGMLIETKLSKVKKLPLHTPTNPEELRSLIDLALMTHDKAWFEELRAMQAMYSFKATGSAGRGNNEKGEDHRWRLSI